MGTLSLPASTDGAYSLEEIELMVLKAREFSLRKNLPIIFDYNRRIVKPVADVDERQMRENIKKLQEIGKNVSIILPHKSI